ncbi:hypothetical protein [Sphingobium sp. AS12]|uniref:hypothetical protein n=1 Tax=Sphingobium sp. AS12 TaxID=2849495 RepID=UPI0034A4E0B2
MRADHQLPAVVIDFDQQAGASILVSYEIVHCGRFVGSVEVVIAIHSRKNLTGNISAVFFVH